MRFISVRDLRNAPTEVWDALEQEDLVLTSNGKPKAVLVRVADDDLDKTMLALRRARAQAAASRLRAQAAARGTSALSDDTIAGEIADVRRRRSAS